MNPPTFDCRPSFGSLGEYPNPSRPSTAAKVLLKLGDSINTDHISPAGSFPADGPAGHGWWNETWRRSISTPLAAAEATTKSCSPPAYAIKWPREQKVDMRSTMKQEKSCKWSTMRHKSPHQKSSSQAANTDGLLSRLAKGTYLLGVKAVIATSFERIHRPNLVGMGAPLTFKDGETHEQLGTNGHEISASHSAMIINRCR